MFSAGLPNLTKQRESRRKISELYRWKTNQLKDLSEMVNDGEGTNDITVQLFRAAYEGQLENIKSLVINGADVNKTLKDERTILNFAIMSGNLEVLKYLIEEHNITGSKMENLLYFAAYIGSLDIVKYLIEVKHLDLQIENTSKGCLLSVAISGKNLEVVKYLIENVGIPVNSKEYTYLRDAVFRNNFSVIEYLVNKGANIQLDESSLMNAASANSNLKVFKYIFELLGVSLDLKCTESFTFALFDCALSSGNFEVLKYLVEEEKCNVGKIMLKNRNCSFIPTKAKCNLFYRVARKGTLEIVKYFLEEQNFSALLLNDSLNKKILHNAVVNKNLEVIEYFVEELGLDINAKCYSGRSLLFNAVSFNNLTAIKYLVQDKKMNIHLKDEEGRTVLHLAAENGSLEMVQYFVEECKANLNSKDSYGLTPLFTILQKIKFSTYKFYSKNHKDTIKYLIKQGADLNELTIDGENMLHLAADEGDMELIKILVEEKGMPINNADLEGQTALLRAGEAGQLEAIKYLIEIGADVFNYNKFRRRNILHLVAKLGNVEIIKMLVEEKGMHINTKDCHGQTPLFYAVNAGKLEAVKYFIETKNADININGRHHETLLFSAVRSANVDLFKYLVDRGVDPMICNEAGKIASDYTTVETIHNYLHNKIEN